MAGNYDNIAESGYDLAKKGIFVSKTAVILSSILVVLLLVGEGLIIGLVGRPECETYAPVLETTKPPLTTTTSTESSITTTTEATGPWTNIRLPNNLVPDHYDVELRPILEIDEYGKYWFKGSSTVRYQCREPTNYLIIHSYKLDFTLDDVNLEMNGGTVIPIKNMMFYEPNNFLIVETDNPCVKDAYYKFIVEQFTGELSDDLNGLYRSEYDKSNGEHVVIATTQMEAVGARETFPCFDEPALKATFIITLWHNTDSDYFSISNMPEETQRTETIDGKEWTATVFEITPVMPTYLLAMVVCDFSYAENFTTDGVQTRIYGRSELILAGEAEYAARITPHMLEYFADYLDVEYTLPKSDQIGMPDFGAGAMENWGLVIYREPYLFYNKNTTSISYYLFITSIVAHELAHQWFGNLVSPAWWNEIWLNEGFATYFSYLAEADTQPTWKSMESFITSEMQSALNVDALPSSHPLKNEVNTPNEISAMFSTISYSKGGCILRMINGFLGEDNFIKGLTNYLKAHQYDVATGEQLFSYWTAQASALSFPTELSIILETWTVQMGYPVVTVRDQDPIMNTFLVTQDYFLIDPDAQPVHTPGSLKYGYKWYIPFTYKKGSNLGGVQQMVWLSPDESVTLQDSEFILGNVRAVGYYRVNYDRDSWDRIAARLDSMFYKDIPEENRAQLLDDAFSLASSRRLDITVPVAMASYLSRDDSYIAWDTFMGNIRYFEYMLGRTPVFGTFCNYILELVVPSVYTKYGWDETDTSDSALIERMTREIGIDAACYYGYDDCISKAQGYFSDWMNSPDDWIIIPASFRSDVLCTAIRNGGTEEWNFAWERFKVAAPEWSASLRYGMACSKDPWILNRYLEMALDSTLIRKQDAIRTMEYVGREEYGKDIAWAFMAENWSFIVSTFGTGWSIDGLISSITRRFSTDYDLQLLEDFKNSTEDLGSAMRAVDQAIDKTKANIKWRAANEESLSEWFYANVDNVV